MSLYQTKYQHFNFKHFWEDLVHTENILISEASVRNILKDAHILPPKARKATKRVMKKALQAKQNATILSKHESQLLAEIQLIEPRKAHPSRPRKNTWKN